MSGLGTTTNKRVKNGQRNDHFPRMISKIKHDHPSYFLAYSHGVWSKVIPAFRDFSCYFPKHVQQWNFLESIFNMFEEREFPNWHLFFMRTTSERIPLFVSFMVVCLKVNIALFASVRDHEEFILPQPFDKNCLRSSCGIIKWIDKIVEWHVQITWLLYSIIITTKFISCSKPCFQQGTINAAVEVWRNFYIFF